MNQLTKTVTPETLQAWGVSPVAQVKYYDGKILVIDDDSEEGGIGTMAKFAVSAIFGVAVFTHAPLVGATMFAYSAYKVLATVGSMYGGNDDLATRVAQDLGLEVLALPLGADSVTPIPATILPVASSKTPTSDELKKVGSVLCDRLSGQNIVLSQIKQRIEAKDVRGGLKMAIEANSLTPETFIQAFPSSGHLYDWAMRSPAAIIASDDRAARNFVEQPPIEHLSVREFVDTTPQGRLTDLSESVAIEVLDGLVASQRSTLLIGGTGSGKSVTQAYLLVNLLKRCPDGEVYVIAQKADSFAGLSEVGRVILFDQFNPGKTLSTIDKVWNEYDRRRKLPESNRVGLPPLRLLLCDWLSINAALESCKRDPEIIESRYLTKLVDVIYNGRELNVCLWIDLQSFNLLAIGMKADANSRRNFNLVGLGNYYVDENGGINESYGVLANMIQSRFFIDKDTDREKIMREFNRLKPISQEHQRPIIFTTLEPARVALSADIRAYKSMQVVKAKPSTPSTPTEEDPWIAEDVAPRLKPEQRMSEIAGFINQSGEIASSQICKAFSIDTKSAMQMMQILARRDRTLVYNHAAQTLTRGSNV